MRIIVIGAGIIGASIARELSRYQAEILVLERGSDLCEGTTKANSAIIHAGYDPLPGSLKAIHNQRGNRLYDQVKTELAIHFERIGSYVLCFSSADRLKLEQLYQRGVSNGVVGLEIIDQAEVRRRLPAVNDTVVAALWAPSAGIIDPFEVTYAYGLNGVKNGVVYHFNQTVRTIRQIDTGFVVHCDQQDFMADVVVNCAGVYSDVIHNLLSPTQVHIRAVRGEYYLTDKNEKNCVTSTLFQLPTAAGKGVLITPTIAGNVLIGPNAQPVSDKEDTRTSAEGLREVREKARLTMADLPFNQVITTFAGLRATLSVGDDFILGENSEVPGFYEALGIDSPGLSSAPSIALSMAADISQRYHLVAKDNYDPYQESVIPIRECSIEALDQRIVNDPAAGRMVCRCEQVSEAEVIAAIQSPLPAATLDGLKRRLRSGGGRCQGGFCTPRILELLHDYGHLKLGEIDKNNAGSWMLVATEDEHD